MNFLLCSSEGRNTFAPQLDQLRCTQVARFPGPRDFFLRVSVSPRFLPHSVVGSCAQMWSMRKLHRGEGRLPSPRENNGVICTSSEAPNRPTQPNRNLPPGCWHNSLRIRAFHAPAPLSHRPSTAFSRVSPAALVATPFRRHPRKALHLQQLPRQVAAETIPQVPPPPPPGWRPYERTAARAGT